VLIELDDRIHFLEFAPQKNGQKNGASPGRCVHPFSSRLLVFVSSDIYSRKDNDHKDMERLAASDVSARCTHRPGVYRLVFQDFEEDDEPQSSLWPLRRKLRRSATRPQHLVSGAQAYSSRRDFVKNFFGQKSV
jgi:hypothetical protein